MVNQTANTLSELITDGGYYNKRFLALNNGEKVLGGLSKVLTPNLRESENESPHDKTNKVTCAPSEDSDQPGHLISLCCPHVESFGP